MAGQGRDEEAEAEYRRALELLGNALGPEHPAVASSRTKLAAFVLDRGRVEEALALAEQAWSRNQRDDTRAEDQASSAFVLVRALWASSKDEGPRGRAQALAKRALATCAEETCSEVEEIQAWIDAHASP